jgi:hypothetical protein
MNELLENLETAHDDIKTMIEELKADPRLATNWRWRENLEQIGYQIMTLLSTEDD